MHESDGNDSQAAPNLPPLTLKSTENGGFSQEKEGAAIRLGGFEPPTYGLGNRRSIP